MLTDFSLLAIMLGRLQMSIDECRAAYRDLSLEAFQATNYIAAPAWKKPWNWKLNGRFDSKALERGIKKIVVQKLKQKEENKGKSDQELQDTLLKDINAPCKV